VFKKKSAGRRPTGPNSKKLMAAVGHGDVVIIAAVDRLSRDTTD
jgi:DNA invertase Pin-like site-specific DNA recombinase